MLTKKASTMVKSITIRYNIAFVNILVVWVPQPSSTLTYPNSSTKTRLRMGGVLTNPQTKKFDGNISWMRIRLSEQPHSFTRGCAPMISAIPCHAMPIDQPSNTEQSYLLTAPIFTFGGGRVPARSFGKVQHGRAGKNEISLKWC